MISSISNYFNSACNWIKKHDTLVLTVGLVAFGYFFRKPILETWTSLDSADRYLAKQCALGVGISWSIQKLVEKILSKFSSANSRSIDLHSEAIDLTLQAKKDLLPTMAGREIEVERVMTGLLQNEASNVLLLGPSGVGKTAIAEGLAHQIAKGKVPDPLKGYRVIRLSASDFKENTSFHGQLETKMKRFIADVKKEKKLIIFIDEIHTLMESDIMRSGNNIQNMLKEVLGRKGIRIIGCTTDEEYTKIMRDRAFNRRFTKIKVPEPRGELLKQMVLARAQEYAKAHGCFYQQNAIDQAIAFTEFLPGHYPAKALVPLDQAGAYLSMHPEYPKIVTSELVENMIGIKRPASPEKQKSRNLVESQLQRVYHLWKRPNSEQQQRNLVSVVGYFD